MISICSDRTCWSRRSTEPGITARQVYLPAGDWYDWHTGELVGGAEFVIMPTPMDRIPIFARGGAVIPMWAEAPPSTNGLSPHGDRIPSLRAAHRRSHHSMLQEDDGLTFAALSGARYRTSSTVDRAGDRVTIRAEVTGDGYPEFARERFRLVLHGAAPRTIRLAGVDVSGDDRRFDVLNAGTGFVAEFSG